jgi:hypothetical protein
MSRILARSQTSCSPPRHLNEGLVRCSHERIRRTSEPSWELMSHKTKRYLRKIDLRLTSRHRTDGISLRQPDFTHRNGDQPCPRLYVHSGVAPCFPKWTNAPSDSPSAARVMAAGMGDPFKNCTRLCRNLCDESSCARRTAGGGCPHIGLPHHQAFPQEAATHTDVQTVVADV